jgi:hypothetical protein
MLRHGRVTVFSLLLALALSLLASGCGGGDDDGGGAGEAKRSIAADAQQHAQAAVLQLSDFPDGWKATPAAEEDESSDDDLRECIGADYSALAITGEASSDDFSMGESAEVSSDATVFDSEDGAARAFEAFSAGMESESMNECMQKLIEQSAETDVEVEIGDVELGELSFTPPAGADDARAWQVAIPVEVTSGAGAGLSPTVFVDMVALREGDTIALVGAFDVLTPFDSELRDQLVAAVAGRAR